MEYLSEEELDELLSCFEERRNTNKNHCICGLESTRNSSEPEYEQLSLFDTDSKYMKIDL